MQMVDIERKTKMEVRMEKKMAREEGKEQKKNGKKINKITHVILRLKHIFGPYFC